MPKCRFIIPKGRPGEQGNLVLILALLHIVDNDIPGLALIPPDGGLTIREGLTNTYHTALTSQPTHLVTVTLATDDQITVASPVLYFTPINWQQPQTVTVVALDDALTEGTHIGLITHTLTSLDPIYAGLEPVSLTATLFDPSSIKPQTDIYLPLILTSP